MPGKNWVIELLHPLRQPVTWACDLWRWSESPLVSRRRLSDAVLSGASRVERARPGIVLKANPGGPCQRIIEILKDHRYEMT